MNFIFRQAEEEMTLTLNTDKSVETHSFKMYLDYIDFDLGKQSILLEENLKNQCTARLLI